MKVLYIVKSKLHFYPPCVSQIRMLKELGVNVEVLFGSCNDNVLKILDNEGVPYKKLCDVRGRFKGSLDKLYNWLMFRRALKTELKSRILSDTLLWFGNAETLLPMKGLLGGKKYAITFLELLDDHPFRMKLLKRMAQEAAFNVSCEETRSYISRAWWKLDKLPYTMPNKPFDNPDIFSTLSDPQAMDIIEKVGDREMIILQGYIKDISILQNFARAIDSFGDKYVLVLMGLMPPEYKEVLNRVSKNIIYSNYIPAPNHLQVTCKASIGLVYYDGAASLNNAYCSPNKIYEYTAFGIPMIANDIPGLKYTVGYGGCAICCELDLDNIIKAIQQIEDNRSEMCKKAIDFYNATDCKAIMSKIIKQHIAL